MKTLKNVFSILFVMILSLSFCQAQESEKMESKAGEAINVYYFHFTHRCETCKAVESVSKAALEELYPEKMKEGQITFQAVNLDESENDALAKELEVSGQTLLFVKGDKQVNLTNDGFMYARTKPEKLKEEIQETINNM